MLLIILPYIFLFFICLALAVIGVIIENISNKLSELIHKLDNLRISKEKSSSIYWKGYKDSFATLCKFA